FRLTATSSLGKKDRDRVTLQCKPSTCGDGIIQADHETCDDGNRLNGDGCDQGCHIELPTPTPTNTIPAATSTTTSTPTDTPTQAGPTTTVTDTPTVTNTPTITDTPTITPTPSSTPTPLPATCGNGVVESGEDCDDGGTCIGGSNAGTPCTSEGQCTGSGGCEAGPNPLRGCGVDGDCPGSRCIHCKPFGGDGCAANCTSETTITGSLVPGAPPSNPAPGTSAAVVRGDGAISNLPLALSGGTVQIFGKQRNGLIPVVQPATGIKFPAIRVSTVAGACGRGAANKPCGGTLLNKDGTSTVNCPPVFTAGSSVCTSQSLNPCTFVHGPGNAATGIIGC